MYRDPAIALNPNLAIAHNQNPLPNRYQLTHQIPIKITRTYMVHITSRTGLKVWSKVSKLEPSHDNQTVLGTTDINTLVLRVTIRSIINLLNTGYLQGTTHLTQL